MNRARLANGAIIITQVDKENELKITSKGKLLALGVCSALVLSGCSSLFNPKSEAVALAPLTMEKLSDKQILHSMAIYEGVSIDGIEVGNKSIPSGKVLLESEKNKLINQTSITVNAGENSYTYPMSDFGVTYDYDKALTDAYHIGRDGEDKARLDQIKGLKKEPVTIDLPLLYNEEKIQAKIADVAKANNVAVVDDTYDWKDGEIVAVKGTSGFLVDEEKLKSSIVQALKDFQPIQVVMNEQQPKELDIEATKANFGVIGEATTRFSDDGSGRRFNIEKTTSIMSGRVLAPGESISMYEQIGDTTIANGYKPSTVILNGRFEMGEGGGACQTATTLYQAALKADLTVVERQAHSRPVGYTSAGLDASYTDGGWKDLVLRNDFSFPVVITGYISGSNVYFEIMGDKSVKNYDVEIWAETTRYISMPVRTVASSTLGSGERSVSQEGWPGYVAVSYKSVNGEVSVIAEDYYQERIQVVYVGE